MKQSNRKNNYVLVPVRPLYRSGEVCVRCGVLFAERMDKWSSECNLGRISEDPKRYTLDTALGHLWNRNPIYESGLKPV